MYHNVTTRFRPASQRFYSFWWSDAPEQQPSFSVVKPEERLPKVDVSQLPAHIRLPYYALTGKRPLKCFDTTSYLMLNIPKLSLAQSFSPNLARDGQQVCMPAANFSVTKMHEENSIIQSPCFFELADKLVAHRVPN
jgi:hypothetical protein